MFSIAYGEILNEFFAKVMIDSVYLIFCQMTRQCFT